MFCANLNKVALDGYIVAMRFCEFLLQSHWGKKKIYNILHFWIQKKRRQEGKHQTFFVEGTFPTKQLMVFLNTSIY